MTSRSEFAVEERATGGPAGTAAVASPAGALALRQRGMTAAVARSRRESPAPENTGAVAGLRASSYLQHLPGVYWSNEFLGRFLLIFESILDPIDRQVADLHQYFDPDTSPRDILDWLASWWNLFPDDSLSNERRRALVESAHEFYSWRGTARGLSLLIRTTLGVEPTIVEPTLADVTQDPDRFAWRFTVRIRISAAEPASDDVIRHLVQLGSPAGTAATVEITRT